jgi:hypothetical protein
MGVEDFVSWMKERRVCFQPAVLGDVRHQHRFPSDGDNLSYINTKYDLSGSDATSHSPKSGHAARRDLKIKLSYLELEGSTRRPTKSICDYGAIIGLLDELLGLLVMEEFPLADGARTE